MNQSKRLTLLELLPRIKIAINIRVKDACHRDDVFQMVCEYFLENPASKTTVDQAIINASREIGLTKKKPEKEPKKKKPEITFQVFEDWMAGTTSSTVGERIDAEFLLSKIPTEDQDIFIAHYVDNVNLGELGNKFGLTRFAMEQKVNKIGKKLMQISKRRGLKNMVKEN